MIAPVCWLELFAAYDADQGDPAISLDQSAGKLELML